jgi:hypothetical protein
MVRVTAVSGAQKVYTVAVASDAVVSGVTITGTPTVGATLTAVAGTVDPSTAQVTYAWRRDGVPISGAVSAQYTVTTADVGHALTVALTASADGFTAATAVSDAVTGQEAPTTPTPSPSGSRDRRPSPPAPPCRSRSAPIVREVRSVRGCSRRREPSAPQPSRQRERSP